MGSSFSSQDSYLEIDFALKELLYLFENMALVVSSAQYIACLELLVTIENIKRAALIYFLHIMCLQFFKEFSVFQFLMSFSYKHQSM